MKNIINEPFLTFLQVCRQWKDIALSMRNGFGSNRNDAMFDVFDIKVNS